MRRANIIVNGLVQGVGFRYFVQTNALKLGLKGFVKNLPTGEVLTVVEGEESLILELSDLIKTGSPYSRVKNYFIEWEEYKNEFINFETRL